MGNYHKISTENTLSQYAPGELMSAREIAAHVGSKNKHFATVMTHKDPAFPKAVMQGSKRESYWLTAEIKRWAKGFKLQTQFGAGKAVMHNTKSEEEIQAMLREQRQYTFGINRKRREPLLMTYAPPLASPYYKTISGWKQRTQHVRPDVDYETFQVVLDTVKLKYQTV
jgi:predicted DNA-binding transcriptional regulator AlpA